MHFIALPWIEEDDYVEFKALIVGLPATYADWLKRHKAAAAFLQEAGGAPEVTVTRDDLRLFLFPYQQVAHEKELWVLAALLAGTPSFF